MTDQPSPPPATPPAAAPKAPDTRQKNVIGLVAFIVSIVGFVFACIPGALILRWILLPIAFILGIVGLVLPNRGKAFALTGLIISVVGTVVAIIVALAVVASSIDAVVGGNDDPVADATPSGSASAGTTTPQSAKPAQESSFENGILTTPELKIEITGHRVVPVGQPGNEYGDKPFIVFTYKTTNLTDKKGVTASSAFLFAIDAYQDTDPNTENELDLGILFDSPYSATSNEDIKRGGTVEDEVAYELDDLTTPVVLVAKKLFAAKPIGTVTYAIA